MAGIQSKSYVLWLLVFAHIFAYADRQVMAVLLPAVRATFNISLVEASLLHGFAFSLFFIFAGVPLGRLVDRTNRKNLLAIGIGLWSLSTIWCGLTSSYVELLSARLAVGVGEAVLTPATASLMADLYSPEKRGRAVTGVQIGAPLGTLLGLTGAGWLLTYVNSSGMSLQLGVPLESWQVVFVLLGSPGLVIAALFYSVHEPERRELASDDGAVADDAKTGVVEIFRQNPVAITLMFVLYSGMFAIPQGVLAWSPSVFMMAYDLNAASAGSIVGIMLIFGAISAYVISGLSSDLLSRWRPSDGRVLISSAMLPIAMLASVFLFRTGDLTSASVALGIILFASAVVGSGGILAVQAVVPNRSRGTLVAVYLLVTNLVGLGITPTVVAMISELWGDTGESLQQALAAFCFGTALFGLAIWPLVVMTYRKLRKFETEEYGEVPLH